MSLACPKVAECTVPANHCKAAVEQSVGKLKGVETCEATPAANTLVVTGTASENDIRKAVEQAGFEFKGVK